ncbi:AAA family ATPase [Caldinitratiruptor microaerophilus]|uniref:ATPase AAA n=1 Tax=Caldinitratiruptor microaerophilus TaxID=671077 RepID=A0AA35CM24_9FIRM|nr:AAA family ATPase [Caldinitratiruptor microaerophilus]BDG60984.1 ATPase AAA [Caldinitratiruptor microaerophilus]
MDAAVGLASEHRRSSQPVFRVMDAVVGGDVQGAVYLHPADMKVLGIEPGDTVRLTGRQSAMAVAMFMPTNVVGERVLLLGPLGRQNAGVGIGEGVRLEKVQCSKAVTVRLARLVPAGTRPAPQDTARLVESLSGVPVLKGNVLADPRQHPAVPAFRVAATVPDGPVRIVRTTHITFVDAEIVSQRPTGVSYRDVGGLDHELARIREIVEWPLRYPRLFERLGVQPPKGVLLYGPPGTGKTLVARALAAESQAYFIHVNGPEVVRKLYGESEARLREIFDEAEHRAPSIIFFDEIDAIAPRRAEVPGEVEKRLVAQFLALLDGFQGRGQVVVIGATNLLENIDPALRRPGRFDREIEIGVPNRDGRLQILQIHTRRLPLAPDVNLAELADRTPGFVGADLAALAQEAAMAAMRRYLSSHGPLVPGDGPSFDDLVVRHEDFLAALREVEPSATREVALERPALGWADVGGLASVKRMLQPWLRREAPAPGRGILLVGPPGCGKTYVARAFAGEAGLPLLEVEAPALYSKWQGESERAVAELFARARRAAPCVLFFDDVDAIAARRTGQETGSQHRLLAQLLREIDRLAEFPEVVLVAATSRPELVDPAVLRPGRFDYCVPFPPLTHEDLREVYEVHTRDLPLEGVDLGELARRSCGLSPAAIAAVCRRARSAVAPDPGPARRRAVGMGAFLAALDGLQLHPASRGAG